MEEAEQSRYVAQLRAEFESCDTTATGFLDRDELTELCRRLQLDAQLPLLLDTLLGEHSYGRVNFEEFKEGFVAVLSCSLDFSTSEDDSSYLEPVEMAGTDVPEEVRPKFVKGTKRYGRRSRPDSKPAAAVLTCDLEDSPPSRAEATDSSPAGVRRAKLTRATSLESVESLKSDDETESQKILQPLIQSKADHQEEEDVSGGRHLLTAACGHLDLQQLHSEDVDVLLGRSDVDVDARVSIREFRKVLCSSTPVSRSTPLRPADLLRAQHWSQTASEERPARSTSPSLLTATVGQRVLSRLDDGAGRASPEQVVALWTEEGIRNGQEILQTLDFSLEDRLSLADLTLALDNELLVSGNGIHQAALISYKNEIQQLQEVAEQACRERDKFKADLDVADQRNLQLVREVDDRHASMETLNESRIRDLELEYRDRLTTLRCQSEQDSEVLLQQVERERQTLREELHLLRAQEAELREELCSATQENCRLEEEVSVLKIKLDEAESSVVRLKGDLKLLLHDKYGGLDPTGVGMSQEERFSEVIREYELKCRELRDRNDELRSELELLKSHRSNRKWRRRSGDAVDSSALSWNQQHQTEPDDSDMKRHSSPEVRKKLQPDNKAALSSLDHVSSPEVSIQTELALEQLKQKHQQELQELNIQLETQVNYYERSLEKMRQSMEVERKDISQSFKLEISEVEEQKSHMEQEVKQLKEALDHLQTRIHPGGGGWSSEHERRMQRERAELEQNFAREISNLVQRLSGEKDQLEAEMKLKLDQEVQAVRQEMELQLADTRRCLLHQEQQTAFWEEQLIQSEQEKRRTEVQHQEEERVSVLKSQEVLKCLDQAKMTEIQLKTQLRDRDQTVASLHSELENQQEVLRSRDESVCRLEEVLHTLRTDRAKLIQDLKDQAMAVDTFQLQLDAVTEELDQRRSLEQVLEQEQSQALQLRSDLAEEREEVSRLTQENKTYIRLADQLSVQIVEMEEEISSLREHLRGLSSQLNDTADLVLDLRRQLNSRTGQVDRLQAEAVETVQQLKVQTRELNSLQDRVFHLQQALQNSQNQLRTTEENFDLEKMKMAQQLMDLEQLVLDLEDITVPGHPPRTQLEGVRLENAALQERLSVLQQEVQNLEDDVAKKRRRLEEAEREHESSREEEERLHRENSRYREEVLDLSSRNLQLSNDNSDLSARLRGEQESVQMLRERLATVSKEQEEAAAMVQRLQDAALQQQKVWTQQKELLDRELSSCKEKLDRHSKLEVELSSMMLKLQRAEQDQERLQRDTDNRDAKVEQVQQQLVTLETEAERLRSQLHAVSQEKLGHAQDANELQRKLRDALNQVEQLEGAAGALARQEEELRVQNQELQRQLSEVQKLNSEQQDLKTRLDQAEAARTQAQDQVLRANATLSVVQAQHLRRLQQLQEAAGGRHREETGLLQARLDEEMRKSQQLEEALKLKVHQSNSQMSTKQGQYEKAMTALQQRVEQLEVKLKAVRVVLQEKVQQLKDQVSRSNKASGLLKQLYVENSELMKALQITEQRQKLAEKKSFHLEEKVSALTKLLRDIVPAALAT